MNKLTLGLAAIVTLVTAALAGPALAEDIEYPAYVPYPFQRSQMTRRHVEIIPYERPFHVRVFTAPQRPPYYNVPAYPVITPF